MGDQGGPGWTRERGLKGELHKEEEQRRFVAILRPTVWSLVPLQWQLFDIKSRMLGRIFKSF